jgi:hypothetical protein
MMAGQTGTVRSRRRLPTISAHKWVWDEICRPARKAGAAPHGGGLNHT